MDLFRVDGAMRQTEILEDYESLVWTERYCAFGDFSLITKRSEIISQNLRSLKYLGMSESNRIMMVETADFNYQTAAGDDAVKLTGRSIEAFLAYRNGAKYNDNAPDRLTGTRGAIANSLVTKYCIDPATAGAVNVIPGLSVAAPPNTGSTILVVRKGDMYSTVKTILEPARLGFMIRVEKGTSNLTFAVYRGVDRSNPATSYYMEYSPNNENLQEISTVESIANFKNHARVNGSKTGVDVYVGGATAYTKGFDRRSIIIDASDIGTGTTTVAEDQADLRERGLDVLADINNRYLMTVDGDIPQTLWNKVYYGLGDIVLVKDTYGNATKCIITEQIWSSDSAGERRTPSFEPL